MCDRVFQRALEPAYETLVDGRRLESAASGEKVCEPFNEAFPESLDVVAHPVPIDLVAACNIYNICGALDIALRERHPLHVRVEQYELPNVPCEAVPDPVLKCFVECVPNQFSVQGMIALSRVWHLDFAGQGGAAVVTPMQFEVVSPCGHMFFDSRSAEGQVGPSVEKLGNPTGNFGDKCAFIDWHGRLEGGEWVRVHGHMVARSAGWQTPYPPRRRRSSDSSSTRRASAASRPDISCSARASAASARASAASRPAFSSS